MIPIPVVLHCNHQFLVSTSTINTGYTTARLPDSVDEHRLALQRQISIINAIHTVAPTASRKGPEMTFAHT